MSEDTVNIEVDGRPLQARRGQMLIEVTDEAGIYIPRFCYHRKLSVAANCRMCLVEVERAPKPLPACATPVAEGMKVQTRSALAVDAQKGTMEFLLINHPLDCPICDQGGECELQDLALGYGADVGRFSEKKRVVKDKNIGPLIQTEMTRCIHCTRCVRFGEEVVGLKELGATGRGEHMEIGTYIARTVTSEMSGNVIDLCPVGALTSKPFRFTARSWEMVQRDSVAPHDGMGSAVHLHCKGPMVKRVVPKENEAVNEVWISDRDRFSYEGLASPDRLTVPMVKEQGQWREVDWETALAATAEGLRRVVGEHGPRQLGALAWSSATVEEFHLLARLVRELGSSNIDHRVDQVDFSDDAQAPLFPSLGMSIVDLERLNAALLVGSHIRKEQPIANHRLRKAALRGAELMVVNPLGFEFNWPVAEGIITGPAGMVASLAGIARALLDLGAKGSEGLAGLLQSVAVDEAHRSIARRLQAGERVGLLLGQLAVAHPQFAQLRYLSAHIAAMSGARLGCLPRGGNSAGAWLAGVLPHRKAGGEAVAEAGLDARRMLQAGLKAYLLLGMEPELDAWDGTAALRALGQAEQVVALSAYRTPAMESYAHVMLPIGLYPETSGTYVNAEGRWQSFEGAVPPPGHARPAWKVLRVLGNRLELAGFDYQDSGEVRAELERLLRQPGSDGDVAWPKLDALDMAPAAGIQRITEIPCYAVDPLVRRAKALQQTADAGDDAVHLNPRTAQALGLTEGGYAQVGQDGRVVRLAVRLDARVPEGAALIYGGRPATAGLGPRSGTLDLRAD